MRNLTDAEGVAAFARRADVSAQYCYDVLRGQRKPGPKILEALGIEEVRQLKDGAA